MRTILFLILSAFACEAAELWADFLDSSRATSWEAVGATITNRSIVFTQYTSSATAANIQGGINACPADQVVLLQAGTYSLSAGLSMLKNITLRGEGANRTKLKFTGTDGCFFPTPGSAICINSGENNYGPNGGVNSANWTAGYSIGTVTVTLSSVTSLAVGDQIILDQLDDTVDGYPSAGLLYMCDDCTRESGSLVRRTHRNQAYVCRVTSVSGSDVGISPALIHPNWRSGQTPGAWWGSNPPITNVGIEELSMDISEDKPVGILMFNAANIWVKGCRILITNFPSGGTDFRWVRCINTDHVTIRDNYMWGPTNSGAQWYGVSTELSSHHLIENNIFIHNPGIMEHAGPDGPTVWGYNYARTNSSWVNSSVLHSGGSMFTLLEGNDISGISADLYHGTSSLRTFYRNYCTGGTQGSVTADTVVWITAFHRCYNFLANVFGGAGQTIYEEANGVDIQSGGGQIYCLGDEMNFTAQPPFRGDYSPPPGSPEAAVTNTMYRWGNWDTVSGTNRLRSGEVPTGLSSFSQSVPSATTFPASFYRQSRPSAWWATTYGTPAWPPIGYGVSGGTIRTNANKIPARLVADGLPTDSEYSLQGIQEFSSTNYFAATDETSPPTTKRKLRGLKGFKQ
jgi:hypothetical protein